MELVFALLTVMGLIVGLFTAGWIREIETKGEAK